MLQIQTRLIGALPKKGTGTLESGESWSTDRVDLHCETPLDISKGGVGFTSTTYRLEGHDKWRDTACSLVGQDVFLTVNLVSNGNAGNTKMVCTGIQAANPRSK